MCMIIVKEHGVELPSNFDSTLEYCYQRNSDGMGIALKKKNSKKIYINKTFKKLKHLKKFIKRNVNKEDFLIIHFRLASKGNKSAYFNRHPFPVTNDIRKLTKLELECDMIVAHNGTISNFGDHTFSDTFKFVEEILGDPVIKATIMTNKAVQKLVKETIGSSRMIILSSRTKNALYFGSWEKEDGIKYSNSNYKKREVKIKVFSHYYNFYDDYYRYLYDDEYFYDTKERTTVKQNKRKLYLCDICKEAVDSVYLTELGEICKKCYDKFVKGGKK